MVNKEYFKFLEELKEEKGLTYEQVIEALSIAFAEGVKKTYGIKSARVAINPEKYEIRLFRQYYVYSKISDIDPSSKEFSFMSIEEAKMHDPKIKPDNILEIETSPDEFSITGAREFKGKFKNALENLQKHDAYEYYKSLKGELIAVRVIDADSTSYRVEINKNLTAIIPKNEVSSADRLNNGDRTRVFVTNVELPKNSWPKLYLTRKGTEIVKRLFEDFIPEIKDQTIEILGISREPGVRTKVGLRSKDPKIDPIGATVGKKGERSHEIVTALSGEKIDLFKWSDNEAELIANSLQPAKVTKVVKINTVERSAIAIVPDDQLTLAIGTKGMNVALAARAINWQKIDIKSQSKADEEGILY